MTVVLENLFSTFIFVQTQKALFHQYQQRRVCECTVSESAGVLLILASAMKHETVGSLMLMTT